MTRVRYRVGVGVAVFLLFAAAPLHASAQNSKPSIGLAAKRIIAELSSSNFAAFDKDVSSEGLLFVRREPDWRESNRLLRDAPPRFWPRGHTHTVSLRGLKAVIWKEYEVPFAKPNLKDPAYIGLLKQYRGLILESRSNYHGLIASYSSKDGFWFAERELGPNIFGKIASDEGLFLYLRQEAGNWKVWRMELWQRGSWAPRN